MQKIKSLFLHHFEVCKKNKILVYSVSYRNHGSIFHRKHDSQSWPTFFSVFDRVGQLHLAKKNGQIVGQELWEISMCKYVTKCFEQLWKNIKSTRDSFVWNGYLHCSLLQYLRKIRHSIAFTMTFILHLVWFKVQLGQRDQPQDHIIRQGTPAILN